ncbi:glycosyltransferase family 4 protein [Sphingorhabdus sp.]|uniref:glycosyltransferase family 4 protein n=1 Tax=Sphingorhabdus sp. TaxID=1902408 RepID=UPI00391CBE88
MITPFSIQASQNEDGVEAVFGRAFHSYPIALLQTFGRHPGRFLSSWSLALRHRPPGLRALLWSQFHFVEAMLLATLMKTAGCTHLHNHFANSAATVGLIAAHYLNIPWSFTLHGISETDYPAGVLLSDKLERADFVACASYFMRAQAMRAVDFQHWEKMHIIRCGVDVDRIQTVGDSLDASRRTIVEQGQAASVRIITVGRLSAEKGYFGLLEVLARLHAKGAVFTATIVGDGPSGDAIHATTKSLALDRVVRFTGALPEPETLWEIEQSDIMVLPSLMEGLPVVLIEALAMRKAVVASQVAGIPELVSEGVTGLLFTPSNWVDLEQQLSKLLANPEMRTVLGRQGFNRVQAEFGSAPAAEILKKLFVGAPKKDGSTAR